MLNAAIDFWLLPAALFFDAFLPPSNPRNIEMMPLAPAAKRVRRKRKVIRSKRGDLGNEQVSTNPRYHLLANLSPLGSNPASLIARR